VIFFLGPHPAITLKKMKTVNPGPILLIIFGLAPIPISHFGELMTKSALV
jgi:hypothetical protein